MCSLSGISLDSLLSCSWWAHSRLAFWRSDFGTSPLQLHSGTCGHACLDVIRSFPIPLSHSSDGYFSCTQCSQMHRMGAGQRGTAMTLAEIGTCRHSVSPSLGY